MISRVVKAKPKYMKKIKVVRYLIASMMKRNNHRNNLIVAVRTKYLRKK